MNSNITNQEFYDRLEKKLSGILAIEILGISGIYEILAEEFNNEIIEEFEKEQSNWTGF